MSVISKNIKQMFNNKNKTSDLESYFKPFRDNIAGVDQEFMSPLGKKKIVYADWTASGRLYRPIEEKLLNEIGPLLPIPIPKLLLLGLR
ncbi:hypothetical protein LX77_01448 [Gelidibacter algens]|uniref:Uncharacterized protein n=1 Tax=Gelidibacter algens TaxID=49280 RepID=A0A327SHB6_9FLAO|nr:hypothetical protein LX77_01448 [Gelidibacter algens]